MKKGTHNRILGGEQVDTVSIIMTSTGCSGSKVPKITAFNTKKYLGTKNIWNIILYLSMIHLCIHDFF